MQMSRGAKRSTAAMAAVLAFGAAAIAQTEAPTQGGGGFGRGGGQGGGFGRGGAQGGGFGRGGGMMGMGQAELTLVSVPVEAMTTALQLTESQQATIKTIQNAIQQQRQAVMSQFQGAGGGRGGFQGGPGGQGGGPDAAGGPAGQGGRRGGRGGQGGVAGGQGGGVDQAARQQRMEQMRVQMQQQQANETKAASQIEAVLTPEQKAALPGAMREWKLVQQLGLPLEVASALKLTGEQQEVLERHFSARQTNRPQGGRQGGPQAQPPGGQR